jgi:integrase/recombinase XerC
LQGLSDRSYLFGKFYFYFLENFKKECRTCSSCNKDYKAHDRKIQRLSSKRKRLSQHTVRAYETDLLQLRDYLAVHYDNLLLEQAHLPILRSWVVSLVEGGMNPTSVNRKIATLHSFYKYLYRHRLIDKDYSRHLNSLKKGSKLPSFVDEKSMTLLFDQAVFDDNETGKRDKLILELLYGTGIRLAELIALTRGDIDFSRQTIRVFGKRSKERMIPVNISLMALLHEYLANTTATATEPLFVTDKGEPLYPMLIQRMVKKYLSGITTITQKSPHVLRHSYATHLLDRGADLNAVKELLGHASLAATQVYTHTSIEKLKETFKQAHPKA